jgi:hypothetical protein
VHAAAGYMSGLVIWVGGIKFLRTTRLSAYSNVLCSVCENRNMHSLLSTVSPEHIAAMSGGNMSPDMVKYAADMMKQMSPDDLQRMVSLASNIPGGLNATRSSGMPHNIP